jgi:uncharacterized protein YdcH (DUF465 family)
MGLGKEKRKKLILFVVDTSGELNMNGKYLETANRAMESVISNIRTIQEKRNDIEFDIATLQFYGTIAKLRPPSYSPQNVSDYSWNDLKNDDPGRDANTIVRFVESIEENINKNRGYGANISRAFQELIEKNVFDNCPSVYLPPAVVFLISNTVIIGDYREELEILKGKPRFNSAFKRTITVDDEVSREKLNEITGNEKNVFVVRKPKELSERIREITITGALYGLNVDDEFIREFFGEVLDEECIQRIYRNIAR